MGHPTSETCSHCSNEPVTWMNQQPFCEEHGQKKKAELEEKLAELRNELEAAREHFEELKEEYNVEGYGEIEHQYSVEGRDDITEEDVQKVSDAENELAAARQEVKGIEAKLQSLESGL